MLTQIMLLIEKIASPFYRYVGGRDEFWRIFRYLCVGFWNTVVGLGLYSLFVSFSWGREHYILVTIPSTIISITNAFICYKLIVFKTKGNWWQEYLKTYVVYSGAYAFSVGALYLLVHYAYWHPIAAQAVILVFTTIMSYLGHKFFSFGKRKRLND